MKQKYILGLFECEEKLVQAAQTLYDSKIEMEDIYTPFPVHGLDDLLNIKRTNLPWVTFIAGAIGGLFAMGVQVWTSYADWPLNVGGKPFLSIPAFVPIAFELTVLFGALTTVLAFLFKGNLFPGKIVDLKTMRQTDDQFVIAIKKENAKLDLDKLSTILKANGAVEIKVID